MANSQLTGVLRHLRRSLPQAGGPLTDGQLLGRFLATRDEAAFEALLRRHGPMVLGVCRRVLRSLHDAEDAFQATFIVLVCKASSVASRESVGSWLYGVAYRTAQKARTAAARRRTKERHMARPEAQRDSDPWAELRPLIDEELSRLPDLYREAFVLCDLEGLTHRAAARRLGCPEGTLSARLSRARETLARRLARRGVALTSAAVALGLAGGAASACVPAPLIGSTVRAAALVAAGHAVAGALPGPVAALTEGVLKTMTLSKVKLMLAAVAAVGLFVAGWGAYRAGAEEPRPGGNTVAPAVAPAVGATTAVAAPAPVEPAKDEKIDLPQSQAPTQVLASLDKDDKLVIKVATMQFVPAAPNPAAPGAPGGGPGGGGGGGGGGPGGARAGFGRGQMMWTVQTYTYSLDDVEVLDTKGKTVDKKDVIKQLKEETLEMASLTGQPVDPLHLRLLKDGTLTFVLPAPKGGGFGGGGMFVPGGNGAPGKPGGANFVPGAPAPPAPPAPPEKP
jgi:RNA polymerase sigma factor (sigma-70 family)